MKKKNNGRIIVEEIKSATIDKVTGEVVEHSQTIVRKKTEAEPGFIKLYTKDLCRLKEVPKTANSVLNALLEECNYDNEIVLNKYTKEKICKNHDIKMKSLQNAITQLYTKQIIGRIGTGVYVLNPSLFGKGNWADIKELRMAWDYSEEGRELEEVKVIKIAPKKEDQPMLPFDENIIEAVIEN